MLERTPLHLQYTNAVSFQIWQGISLRKLFPGLLLAAVTGGVAKFVALWAGALGDVSIAIILGILIANVRTVPLICIPGIKFSEKALLSLAVILMGFGLNWKILSEAGLFPLIFITGAVAFTVSISFILGKFIGVKPSLSLLLGMGNAICGASAIAASASLLTENKEDIGIAVSVVNLLGTLGIFILPAIVTVLNMNGSQASLLVGGTLQAVGHVVAAGYTVSHEVGELSLAVKMGRIFLLAPALIILAWIHPKAGGSQGCDRHWLKKLPPYLYGFVFCAFVGNFASLPDSFRILIKFASHHLLLIAMAAVGLQIRFSSLIHQGPKALALGSGAFAMQVLLLISLLLLGAGLY